MTLNLQEMISDRSNPVPSPNYATFGIHDLEGMLKESIEITEENILSIEDSNDAPTFDNTIRALEEATIVSDRVSMIVRHYSVQYATPEFNSLYKETLNPMITGLFYRILNSKKLFERVKIVKDSASHDLEPDQTKLLDNTYDFFVNEGALLSEEDRATLEQLSNRLTKLSSQFRENVTRATNDTYIHVINSEEISDISEDVINRAKKLAEEQKVDGWLFNLQPADYGEIMQNCSNRDLREKLWRSYMIRCNEGLYDNNQILREIASIREQSANIKGFETHGDYVMQDRMLKSPQEVIDFIEEIYPFAIAAAKDEVNVLRDFARNFDGNDDIQPWDISYYSKAYTKQYFNYDSDDFKPYLEIETVKQGLFGLLKDLYGIKFVQNSNYTSFAQLDDIVIYDVYDEDGSIIGNLSMDLFARDHKKVGAWAFQIANHYQTADGHINLPVVDINMNILKPNEGQPILLSMGQAKTLYHEMGHALHSLFSKARFSSLSGTSVAWDFVELPSQIMENWLDDIDFIQSVAVHHKTGEKIPLELLQSRDRALKDGNAIPLVRQLQMMEIDIAWNYYTPSPDTTPQEIEQSIKKRDELLPAQNSVITTSFAHIFAGGYACGYYSYLWSEVLDNAAFKVFEKAGLRNREVGDRFRQEILSKGSTVEPLTLFENFTGQSPDVRVLLEKKGLLSQDSSKKTMTLTP